MDSAIADLLQPFQKFGVNLGLSRMKHLLLQLGNPHHQVPIVHCAGTNGKGSVCAYLSAVLTAAGHRVGCYTSPHLISWCERIALNQVPIAPEALHHVLSQVIGTIDLAAEPQLIPTQFEVITAAAWLYFAQVQVDLAVMEVGLGGRLDATNVGDRPLATIITSIGRDHWQVLGNTLGEIAGEKAGILKPHCPAIIGPLAPEAEIRIKQRIKQLNCPVTWISPAQIRPYDSQDLALGITSPPVASIPAKASVPTKLVQSLQYGDLAYCIQLQGQIQQTNSAIAIATLQTLQYQGWSIPPKAIQTGMAQAQWPGRLQWLNRNDRPLLIDGAHNPEAALALRHYLDHELGHCNGTNQLHRITWVMGMLKTKDCEGIFRALLRPPDRLYLVPVSHPDSTEPEILATLAQEICPGLTKVSIESNVFSAITQAQVGHREETIVLCGSLYLVGEFLAQV
jgi:dihydrofolate synthase/folylpolyglutamate synthase